MPSALETLQAAAEAYPETWVDHPWGEVAVKVRKKVFVFLHQSAEALHVTVKLPVSGEDALGMPGVSPTGYGLGRHGWVSAKIPVDEDVPVEMLRAWIDESYRAVAPETLVKTLPSRS